MHRWQGMGWAHEQGVQAPTHVVAGLSPDVQRTSIEGMGCLTGFRLLNMAQQVAQGTPEAPHH